MTRLEMAGGQPALQLVELNGMLFSGSIHGADPASGELSADPERQFDLAFQNLQALLRQAGASPRELGLVTVCIPGASHREYINKPWLALFPDDAQRPARKTNQYPLPEGMQVQLQVLGVKGQQPRALRIRDWAHQDPLPPGVKMGDVVFSSVITGQDAATNKQSEDPEAQIRQALANLEALVKDAGGSWDDVLHVLVFMKDRKADQPKLDKIWQEIFVPHGQCPARKAIDYQELRGTSVVQLQTVALIGHRPRRDFLIENVPVHDTGTMGARIGNLVWSCGLSGNPGGTLGNLDEQLEWSFKHTGMFLKNAGGSPDDIGSITVLVRDYKDEPRIMQEWRGMFPDPSDEPARHIAQFGLNPLNTEIVQLHVAAAL